MDFLSKLIYKTKKPTFIGIAGENRKVGLRVLIEALNRHLKVAKLGVSRLRRQKTAAHPRQLAGFFSILRNNIFIAELDSDSYFLEKASLPILVVTAVGQIPPDQDFFAGPQSKVKLPSKLIKKCSDLFLVINYDDETVREIGEKSNLRSFSYGLGKGSDFQATDIGISRKGTNFKINYQGNTVPVWLKNLVGKRQIYGAVMASAVGVKLGLNLLKISQTLKFYSGIKGEGRLIDGIKHSTILDDSANANPFSMAETLKILGEIEANRKIAVLGDILRTGKYAIETHEAMGERAAENTDLLFTVGSRAKFIGKEANIRGIPNQKIFHFDGVGEAGRNLQNEIRKGDLILVDGSAEMKMGKIVEEIKKK